MAENIGKVVVSIEARVEELEKGMAKAEATVRRSSAKIEANQKSLANKIGKSWTELSSKLNVITTVANIAEKAWNTLDGVLTVVTDSTKNASNKILGSMEVMEKSSIPVVSQFMKIGHGIHGWVSGEKKLRAEIDKTNAALEQRYDREHKALDQRIQAREALEGFIQVAAKSIETENATIKETTNAGKLRLEQDAERIALQDEYTKKLAQVNPYKTTEGFFKRTEDAFNTAMGQLQETHHLEMSLAKEADRNAAQAEEARLKAIDDQALARIKAAKDEAKHLAKIAQQVQNQTDDLQTRLTQLSLEDLGLDLESKLTGIHAKFDRLRQNANSEQIALLNQIEAIENKRAKAVHSETTARENDRKAAEKAAEMAANKSKLTDLTTEVTVKTLEAAGETMAAQLVSIHAKFKKMREGATANQLTQIAKLEQLAKSAALVQDAPEPDEVDTAQVASISTALGSFTVGLDHQAVVAKQSVKQSTLLGRILSATSKSNTPVSQTATAAKKQVTLLGKVNNWLQKITGQVKTQIKVDPRIEAASNIDESKPERILRAIASIERKPEKLRSESDTEKLSEFNELVKEITEETKQQAEIQGQVNKWLSVMKDEQPETKKQITLLEKINGWIAKIAGAEQKAITKVEPKIEPVQEVKKKKETIRDLQLVMRYDPRETLGLKERKSVIDTKEDRADRFKDQLNEMLGLKEVEPVITTLPDKAMNDMLAIFKAKEVEPVIATEVAVDDNEVRIIDMVSVSIPEKQIALLTEIADKTHAKEQVQVLEKIAASSAKVAQALNSPTASGIIIAS